MSAIITSKFRVKNAKNMIATLGDDSGAQSYYAFIGRTEQWTNDNIPPSPIDRQLDEHDARHNMLAMKKITSSYLSHMAPRYNFIAGQSYDAYDDTAILSQKQYYCVTDALNVYKCIKAGISGAVIEPTHTTTDIPDPFEDGYQWKYLFTIDGNQVNKFITGSFIPVPTPFPDTYGTDAETSEAAASDKRWLVQNSAIDGAIHAIVVTSGGTGYNITKPTVTIVGNGVSCTVNNEDIDVDNATGAITNIRISSLSSALRCGEGYTQASVKITGGSGTGATARAIISPQGGHGSNLIEELNAFFVCVDTKFIGAELDNTGDFLVDNWYRQIGIIKDPLDNNGDICADTTYRALTTLKLTNTPAFAVNTLIECVVSGAKGWIDSIDSANNLVKIHQNIGTGFIPFANGNEVRTVVNTVTTTAQIVSNNGVTPPEFILDSGEIIYIENITPVKRQSGQTEDVKLILEM